MMPNIFLGEEDFLADLSGQFLPQLWPSVLRGPILFSSSLLLSRRCLLHLLLAFLLLIVLIDLAENILYLERSMC